jgi:hypothetical protein
VHGVDAEEALVVAKAVRRGQLLSFSASLPQCEFDGAHKVAAVFVVDTDDKALTTPDK